MNWSWMWTAWNRWDGWRINWPSPDLRIGPEHSHKDCARKNFDQQGPRLGQAASPLQSQEENHDQDSQQHWIEAAGAGGCRTAPVLTFHSHRQIVFPHLLYLPIQLTQGAEHEQSRSDGPLREGLAVEQPIELFA